MIGYIFSPGAPAITMSWCIYRWPGDVSTWDTDNQYPVAWPKVRKFITRYVVRWYKTGRGGA
jgi:hypothetical protein